MPGLPAALPSTTATTTQTGAFCQGTDPKQQQRSRGEGRFQGLNIGALTITGFGIIGLV